MAGGLITSKQIKDGTIKTKDLNKLAVKALSGKTGPAGPAGATGATGAAGAAGPQGVPGTARAYAHINGTTVTDQSGGITATVPYVGEICVTVPGLTPNNTAAVAMIDWTGSNITATRMVSVNSATFDTDCGQFTFLTYYFDTQAHTRTGTTLPFYVVFP